MTGLRDEPEAARRLLNERRAELGQLLEQGEEATAPVELDPHQVGRDSRLEAQQQQAIAQDTERRRRLELLRIDAALERLEQGEYGLCLACGTPIAEARLKLDPAVALCIACADRS
jgi:DnaK suppressor protein